MPRTLSVLGKPRRLLILSLVELFRGLYEGFLKPEHAIDLESRTAF